MIKYAYRVLETTVTQGTGTINLDGEVAGFISFVDGVGSGSKVNYTIQEGANIESGIGMVTAGSPDTLSRDTIIFSTNGNNAINWGAGTRNVFLSVSPELQVWRDENLNDVSAVGVGGGTANAHTVTYDPAPLNYSDKMIIRWPAPANNTDNITVNVNSLGAKAYVNADLTNFPSGMIKSGSMQEAVYDAANNRFIRTTQAIDASNFIPWSSAGDFATEAQGTKADAALPASSYHVTPWVAYTPTFTGLGTVTGIDFKSRRVGKNLEIRGVYTQGTPTAVEARISLGYDGENGNVVSSSDLPPLSHAGLVVFSLASTSVYGIHMLIEPEVGYMTIGIQNNLYGGLAKRNGSQLLTSGVVHSFNASIPIQGW